MYFAAFVQLARCSRYNPVPNELSDMTNKWFPGYKCMVMNFPLYDFFDSLFFVLIVL